MIRFIYRHRVRYRECDPMGIVYHTHYLDYFEAARTEALREFGLAYRELEKEGVIMPVTRVSVSYLRPARYDELLDIHTLFPETPETRVPIEYQVYQADQDSLLVTGQVELCFVNKSSRRPMAPPKRLKTVFSKLRQQQSSDSSA